MDFAETIKSASVILAEGALIERLRRDPAVELDPHVLHAGFVYDVAGRAVLETMYRQYIEVGLKHDLPMIVWTPTWRASPARLAAAGFGRGDEVNGDGFRFVAAIRDSYGQYASRVHVGGLMGCQGDAYDPADALYEYEAASFHRCQAAALADAGADFLLAATLPAASEARGLARAMAECAVPYVLSFVVRPSGTLLDGTPLHQVVAAIDNDVDPPPLIYAVNCAHPTVFAAALERETIASPSLVERVVGLQGNTSRRSPEELDGLDHLEGDDPATFAEAMLDVHRRFGTRILGGCCGTDERHIACIAERLSGATL